MKASEAKAIMTKAIQESVTDQMLEDALVGILFLIRNAAENGQSRTTFKSGECIGRNYPTHINEHLAKRIAQELRSEKYGYAVHEPFDFFGIEAVAGKRKNTTYTIYWSTEETTDKANPGEGEPE